jgi:MOSC domain-containing protein YiiM
VSADGDLPFGVYADVLEPGTVRVGDPVALL